MEVNSKRSSTPKEKEIQTRESTSEDSRKKSSTEGSQKSNSHDKSTKRRLQLSLKNTLEIPRIEITTQRSLGSPPTVKKNESRLRSSSQPLETTEPPPTVPTTPPNQKPVSMKQLSRRGSLSLQTIELSPNFNSTFPSPKQRDTINSPKSRNLLPNEEDYETIMDKYW